MYNEYRAGTAMNKGDNTIRSLRSSLISDESCFYTLFNQAKDSIFIMDPSPEVGPVIVEANETACAEHGYTREEIIGKPIALLDDPEATREIPERTRRLMAGEALTFEAAHVKKDGSVFFVEVSAQIIMLEQKAYILAIDRDITRRKEAERLLKDKLHELQEFYDIAITREEKIKKLQKEVELLRSQLSQQIREKDDLSS